MNISPRLVEVSRTWGQVCIALGLHVSLKVVQLLKYLWTYTSAEPGDVDGQWPVQLLDERCQMLLCVCAKHSWQSEKTPQRNLVRLAPSGSSQQQGPAPFPFSLLHCTFADSRYSNKEDQAKRCDLMCQKSKGCSRRCDNSSIGSKEKKQVPTCCRTMPVVCMRFPAYSLSLCVRHRTEQAIEIEDACHCQVSCDCTVCIRQCVGTIKAGYQLEHSSPQQ